MAASAVFVSVLTATMIDVLVPLIRAQFGASAAEVGWVVTGYSLVLAVALIPFARRVLPRGDPAGERAFNLIGGYCSG